MKPGTRVELDGVPSGFVAIRSGRTVAWVKESFSFLVDQSANWRKEGRGGRPSAAIPSGGRGEMIRVPLSTADGSCGLIRHYRRGGLFRWLFRDLYLGRGRFLREVLVAEWARRSGVATAEVLALRTEGKGCGLYRADLMTREIENSMDLASYLSSLLEERGDQVLPAKREVIRSVACLVKDLHAAGICHADLNLRNILIQPAADRSRSFIIDLDKAWIAASLHARARLGNLQRLYRSAEKLGYMGHGISRTDCLRFIKEYSAGEPALASRLKRLIRNRNLSLLLHRLVWRLSGRQTRGAMASAGPWQP